MKSFQQKRDPSFTGNPITSNGPVKASQLGPTTQSMLYIQSNTYGGRGALTNPQNGVNNVILGQNGGGTGGTGTNQLLAQKQTPLDPLSAVQSTASQSKSMQRPAVKSNESQKRQLQITNSNVNNQSAITNATQAQPTNNILSAMSYQKQIMTNQTLQQKNQMQNNTKSSATQPNQTSNGQKLGTEGSITQSQNFTGGSMNGTQSNGIQPQPQNTNAIHKSKKSQEIIVIHVFDENRKVNKDFTCEKELLVTHMKYFEKYLTEATSVEDIDISVHCDIKIFEWLMKYLGGISQEKVNPDEPQPKLDIKNVISILISSDFLQMQTLVQECIDFVIKNLHDVVRLPIDMNCLNPNLIKRISNQVTIERLDDLVDKRDKLTSKLFMKKLQTLINQNDNNSQSEAVLNRCIYCGQLYTNEQNSWMICPSAEIFIDFHGQVIAQHVSDRFFDLNGFIQYMNNQKLVKWKDIYWKIWARLITLECQVCSSFFVGSELLHCRYHPQKPKFNHGSNKGTYPCCGTQALRFSTDIEKKGCQASSHSVKIIPEIEKDYQTLVKHQDAAVDPFQNGTVPAVESLQGLLDQYIADLKTKQAKLRQKRKPNKSNLQNQNGESPDPQELEECEDDLEEDDDDDFDYIETQLMSNNNQNNMDRQAMQNMINNGEGGGIDKGKRQKMWKRDMVRSDDFFKMKDMVGRLKKQRKNENRDSTTSAQSSAVHKKQGQLQARTSIQQTQGSNNLIKKETLSRKGYANK